MALVVEDGTGKSTAESYLSVADCDTYHTKHGDSSDWSGADTSTKEEALRMATQYLDLQYGKKWKGKRKTTAQALAWPRNYVYDYDGIAISDDSVPTDLESATAETALLHITEDDGLIPNIEDPGGVKREKLKAGPAEIETEYFGGMGQVEQFRKVDLLVQELIEPTGIIQRG
jgi:hypothetical protein